MFANIIFVYMFKEAIHLAILKNKQVENSPEISFSPSFCYVCFFLLIVKGAVHLAIVENKNETFDLENPDIFCSFLIFVDTLKPRKQKEGIIFLAFSVLFSCCGGGRFWRQSPRKCLIYLGDVH